MAGPVLIINPGSSSKKLALYRGTRQVACAHIEHENGGVTAGLELAGTKSAHRLSTDTFAHATDWFLRQAERAGVLRGAQDVSAVGLRIVASGEAFRRHRVIDEHYERQIRTAYDRSPLHLGPALAELDHARQVLPHVPIVGVSDSAFHLTLPEHARRYAIPAGDAERRGLFRYGFHGISVGSVVRTVRRETGRMPARAIICHLGSGASITALQRGKSVDTSMGATPMEGLIMATRAGDVDPGILLEMAAERSARQVETDLNRHSGLLALGGSDDIRELLKRERKGDARAKLALDAYAYRVRKYVGAYAAVLGGLDLLVFTGTVGERSVPMRKRMCQGLDYLGIRLDATKNRRTDTAFASIGAARTKARVLVVPTDELGEMARATTALLA
ncbi:MAG: acetate/propionate family kinase [bacterium]|nr:acetate/propionate family kinase [bacterium]